MSGPTRSESMTPEEFETPGDYEGWTAKQKHLWIWKQLIGRTVHGPTQLPPLALPFQTSPVKEISVVMRRDELTKALLRTSDLMEPGRPKVIHARGSVAMVELVTCEESPFTGLLAAPPAGGATGLVRMSLVAEVTPNAAYIPALALKFLIDRQPSADVLAMNHTVGQGRDFDLFSNTMTNDLSDEHKELRAPQKLLSVLFDRVSRQPRRLVSGHLTDKHADGRPVAEAVTPRRLVFRPTAEAKQIFRGKAGVDFRLVLAEVPAGTALYEVTGMAGREEIPVGAVRTTTQFRSSEGGDRLFFRHVQDPLDLKV